MAPKKGLGPLTDDEVQARLNKLTEIITNEAQKEINLVTAQSTEDIDELKKTLATEPKQIIDEWIEKLRAFTERQTKIHCARLRRIAKLRILEAYGDIRESIKNEARERIKDKMSKKTADSDRILGQMLLQGLLRLMESNVLVHTTKADLERVGKHYATVTNKYKEMTGTELKLITSRHPLKDHYYGRIVISDKLSSMFVDMNLFTSVDKVADEVFSHYAAYQDKSGTSKNWGMEALKQRGLHIMPRGSHIGLLQLDVILSTMRGDPKTQVPVFQIKDGMKKQEESDETAGKQSDKMHRASAASGGSRKRVTSNHLGKTRKVTIAPENMTHGMRPSLSVMEPGPFGPTYGYRQAQDSSDEVVGSSNDLYNLDFTSTTDLLSQNPSRAALPLHGEPGFTASKAKSISADKEAPKTPTKLQRAEKRSASGSEDSDKSRKYSEDSDISEFKTDPARPSASSPSEDLEVHPHSHKESAANGSPPAGNKES